MLILLGIAQLVRQGEWLLTLCIIGTLGLICLTPWPGQVPRYLAPLTPCLGLCLSLGLLHVARVLAGRATGGLVIGAVVGGLLATQSYIAYAVYRYEHPKVHWDGRPPAAAFRLFFHDDTWRSFDACLDWLKAHATAGDIVATSMPHYAHLRTGLKAVMPPMEVEVAEAQRLLDTVPVATLSSTTSSRRTWRGYAAPAVRSRPDLWELASSPPGGSRSIAGGSEELSHGIIGRDGAGEECGPRRVVALGLLAFVGWLPRLCGPIDLRWDGGAYYALGTSLAQGSGYRLLTDPGRPLDTLHPPLLPALIAVYQVALGTSDPMVVGHALRLSACGMFAIYIVAIYALLRTRLSVSVAFLGSLMCLLNDRTTFMSDLCFPEIPFALASVGCVWVSGKGRGRCGTSPPTFWP